MSFSVILPTLNEKNHIRDLANSISKIFLSKNILFEIIVVDDNSTDGTANIIRQLSKVNKNIKLICRKNKKKNLAQSINEGIIKSCNDFIIWMDADFQHPPRYISNFIGLIKKNSVIVCSRFLPKSKRYFNSNKIKKKINENQSYIYNLLCNFFLFKDFTDYTSGFICIKKELIKDYTLKGYYGDYFVNLIVYLKIKKIKILEIPFKDNARVSGMSKTFVKINLNYSYLCIRYLITLIKNIILRFFLNLRNFYK